MTDAEIVAIFVKRAPVAWMDDQGANYYECAYCQASGYWEKGEALRTDPAKHVPDCFWRQVVEMRTEPNKDRVREDAGI